MSAGNEKCSKIDELLTEAFARELSPEERRRLDDHCVSCPECAAAYRAMLAARDLLRRHRPEDDAPPAEARDALHRRLVEEQDRSSTERSYSGWRLKLLLAGAFACALLIAGVFLLPTLFDQSSGEEVVVFRTTVDAKEPFTVRLTYTAGRPLADVRVAIRLDEGVSFYTDDERIRPLKEYTWKGDFRAGTNDIPFVVEVRRAGVHRIRTSAAYDGYLHRHDVELRAEEGTITVTYLDYPRNRL